MIQREVVAALLGALVVSYPADSHVVSRTDLHFGEAEQPAVPAARGPSTGPAPRTLESAGAGSGPHVVPSGPALQAAESSAQAWCPLIDPPACDMVHRERQFRQEDCLLAHLRGDLAALTRRRPSEAAATWEHDALAWIDDLWATFEGQEMIDPRTRISYAGSGSVSFVTARHVQVIAGLAWLADQLLHAPPETIIPGIRSERRKGLQNRAYWQGLWRKTLRAHAPRHLEHGGWYDPEVWLRWTQDLRLLNGRITGLAGEIEQLLPEGNRGPDSRATIVLWLYAILGKQQVDPP